VFEGFKLKTREKLEKDLGDAVLELAAGPVKEKNILTGDAKIIHNIVHSITGPNGMGIEINSDFIISNVLKILEKAAPTKEQHEKITLRRTKEGKKTTTYDDEYGRPLILLTFVFIAIAIQTNIPAIESNRTFPNCIRAFDGYPTNGTDMAALTYIACIARKKKSSEYPW
jgi:hypothetical protein